MRVLISEYLTSGAGRQLAVTESMRREGLAMLRAITSDVCQIPGNAVVTTIERGTAKQIGHSFPSKCEIIPIEDAAQEWNEFQHLLGCVDAALIIAPETDGILAERCRLVRAAGISSWNCSPESINLCADKLLLADFLQSQGVPTIPTAKTDCIAPPQTSSWPMVLKPRDGAGSQCMFLVSDLEEWERVIPQIPTECGSNNYVVQPFIEGRALSIGVIIPKDVSHAQCLAVAEQQLSNDGRFRYLGGILPAPIPTEVQRSIEQMALIACRAIPGLFGYVGLDLILTNRNHPLIVEINPRLTTSYVGYRSYYSTRLPEYWMPVSENCPLIQTTSTTITFTPSDDGVNPTGI